jgi:hypothetical protein
MDAALVADVKIDNVPRFCSRRPYARSGVGTKPAIVDGTRVDDHG